MNTTDHYTNPTANALAEILLHARELTHACENDPTVHADERYMHIIEQIGLIARLNDNDFPEILELTNERDCFERF